MIKRLFSYNFTFKSEFRPTSQLGRAANYKTKIAGFTLVELLTVLAIFSLLAVFASPALQSLQKSSGFTENVYDLSDTLNLARSYAVANNTYVYVGMTEVDRAQSTSATPQTTGVGRVALVVVSTKDGTSSITASNLNQLRIPQIFDSVHVLASAGYTGNMASRPKSTTSDILKLGSLNTPPTSTFKYPLNSANPTYTFDSNSSWIVCFNPQGEALLNGVAHQWIEVDLQPVSGNNTLTANANNQAALVIDGATGATKVYRP